MLEPVRDALRGFRRRRTVGLTIVLTLALGIGANAAIFSLVDAVLLRPLPYPDPSRLVSVYELNRGLKQATQLVAPVRVAEWGRANRTLTGLAGSYFENMTDTTGAEPQRVEAMRVSPRFFSVLGVNAATGRTLTDDEDRFGGPASIVISDALWRTRFNRDATVLGRTLVLNGVSRTIVGVMPPSFRYPTPTTEVWVPAQMPDGLMRERRARFYTTVGRLAPGVTIEQAEADLTAVQTRLGEQFPDTDRGWGASLVRLKDEQTAGVGRSLWLLFAAVGLLLLAACGNVACLLLADAARREHEIAVRFALGASRAIVVRQLLAEGLVLALIGSTLGLLAARWAIDVLRRTAGTLPLVDTASVDVRVVLFATAVCLATTMVFALAPALSASGVSPADAMTRGGRGHVGTGHLVQRALVAAQVALAVVLLTGASLLVRSFAQLHQVPLGLDPSNVITFRMSASWSEAASAVVGRQARTVARLEAIRGVEGAAVSQTMPAAVNFPPGQFGIVGRDGAEKLFSQGRMVSGGYFRALHIPILQGGTCSSDPAAPLFSKALVTKSFADQFFPGTAAIGQRLTSPGMPPGQTIEIAGVTADVHERGPAQPAEPLIYWCGYSPYWPDPRFIVRIDPARPVSIAMIRAAMLEVEPKRAVYGAEPLIETLAASMAQQRLSAFLLALFASTTLVLAGMGLYGVLSQLVTTRRREIGVRMALGARASQILASIAVQAALVTSAGIAIGLAASLALARFMTALVFGVTPHDPMTFTLVPLVLAAAAAVATLVPAQRAARVDPMRMLREE
jgi:putative ABC transport system permease protein